MMSTNESSYRTYHWMEIGKAIHAYFSASTEKSRLTLEASPISAKSLRFIQFSSRNLTPKSLCF